MALLRAGGLALLLAFPRLGCGPSEGDRAMARVPAPSASVVTIAAELGSCDDLRHCEEQCDAGNSDRCRRLGVNYEFGRGVDVDGARATALYERSCALKNSVGCIAAGRMHEFHHGVPKDDANAVRFYGIACDLGDGPGCVNLAIMLENGRGTPKDVVKAAAIYTTWCHQGSSLACAHAKALHRDPSEAAP